MVRSLTNLMRRSRSLLVPLALMLPVVLLCGWLLLAEVPQTTNEFVIPKAERGWPWVFQSYESFSQPRSWDGLTAARVDVAVLAADLAILLAIIAATWFALLAYRRRYGSWVRFSLRGLLLFIAVCAVPLAIWISVKAGWRREHSLAYDFHRDGDMRPITWTYCGPEWLRRFMPWDVQEQFMRRTTFEVNWDTHENAAVELPAAIGQFRFVTELTIAATRPVEVADAAQLSRIETLTISGAGVNDTTMRWIGKLANLKSFHIGPDDSGPCAAGDRGFAQLANCRELVEIECLVRLELSDAALVPLATFPNLQKLRFRDSRFTPAMLVAIAKLQHLTVLEFYNCTFTEPESLAGLVTLPKLEELSLPQSNLTETALAALAKCPALKKLYIGGCPNITDEGLLVVRKFPRLEHLFLHTNPRYRAETYQSLKQRIADVQAWGRWDE